MEPAPVEATLVWLGLTLAVLSAGVWLMAAATGRWLCKRALTPVNRMARAATAMTAADFGERLPVPGTGDELDDLGRAFNDLLDRLNEAFVRLNEAYDRQRRFAADASHQLRTPIAALLGQAQVALRRDRSAASIDANMAMWPTSLSPDSRTRTPAATCCSPTFRSAFPGASM